MGPVHVCCSVPECPTILRVHGATRYQARLVARVAGWRRIRTRVFCPGCSGRIRVRAASA